MFEVSKRMQSKFGWLQMAAARGGPMGRKCIGVSIMVFIFSTPGRSVSPLTLPMGELQYATVIEKSGKDRARLHMTFAEKEGKISIVEDRRALDNENREDFS